jgi:hypothetical protein
MPLKVEADSIIRELGLIELLQQYGEARIVGSVALDLVVKPDIDIHLLVDSPDLLQIVNSIYPRLLEREQVREVRITDYRGEGGLKIGIDAYPGHSATWSIDLWITNDPSATAFEFTDHLLQVLKPAQREAILEIKQACHQKGLLRDGLSKKIYEAVVNHGIRGLESFQKHIQG